MNGMPIITLQVEQMKYTVAAALSEHTAMMDELVQRALNESLTPENIEGVIRRTVKSCVDTAVSEEIQSFFHYSAPGRAAIREAVQKHMNKHFGEAA